MLPVVIIFLYMAVFDAIGTLVAVGEQAGLMVDGKLPRAGRALAALKQAIGLDRGCVDAWLELAEYWRRRDSPERC